MKIGYPCINYTIGANANKTFRLASYSTERFIETVEYNLSCLKRIIEYNIQHQLLFLRISSETIPFASHPVQVVNWQKHFASTLQEIGQMIQKHQMRISMHPDQFVLINSPRPEVLEASIKDLYWQVELLNLMRLDDTAKVQIHVGGLYGDRKAAIEGFIKRYEELPKVIRNRLVIENDDKLFSLKDCLLINERTGIPIVFDNFHHECLNHNEPMRQAVLLAQQTWTKQDGLLMVDFSSQQPKAIKGKHADTLDRDKFKKFLNDTKGIDFDIMFEIRDKEKSVFKAKEIIDEI